VTDSREEEVRICITHIYCLTPLMGQSADELIAKNHQARGGIEKIKAIHSLRMSGAPRVEASPWRRSIMQYSDFKDLMECLPRTRSNGEAGRPEWVRFQNFRVVS
jgi:hypothetical protein